MMNRPIGLLLTFIAVTCVSTLCVFLFQEASAQRASMKMTGAEGSNFERSGVLDVISDAEKKLNLA